jgi:hypothetical protein
MRATRLLLENMGRFDQFDGGWLKFQRDQA